MPFEKKKLAAAIAAIIAAGSMTGCAAFLEYCEETETREVLRKLNPFDYVDAGVIGTCAAAQAFQKTEEKQDEQATTD